MNNTSTVSKAGVCLRLIKIVPQPSPEIAAEIRLGARLAAQPF